MSNVSFQIVDILSDDITDDQGERKFVITFYGITQDDTRIVFHIVGYQPYFYIKIPNDWDINISDAFLKDICIFSNIEPGKLKRSRHQCKDFYGLYWNHASKNVQEFNFLKISFSSHADTKKFIKATREYYNTPPNPKKPTSVQRHEQWRQVETTANCDSNLYESSVHPIIKFIHDTEIDPTGWVTCKIDPGKQLAKRAFLLDEYTCVYDKKNKNIRKLENTALSRYVIASFDIECDSSHGDFPMAKKNFKKLATDIFDSYRKIYQKTPAGRKETIDPVSYIVQLLNWGFAIDECAFTTFVKKFGDMNEIWTKDQKYPSEELTIKIATKIVDEFSDALHDNDLKSKDRDTIINKIQRIISKACSTENIEVLGDPIIQIGTVFLRYGETKPYLRHILVIGPEDNMRPDDICDDMSDIDIKVERCATERELLIKWKDIIKQQDPDFVTGYNIFGFDFRYITDRVEILFPCEKFANGKDKCNRFGHHWACQSKQFYDLGKIIAKKSRAHWSKVCASKTQELSSSALGENTLNYITMDGRILFDIQKEVQKGHNLESYKLDNVAAHFMRGKLKNVDCKALKVDTTGHLKSGDFISFRVHSNIGEELFQDGRKYQIDRINKSEMFLTEELQLDLKLYDKVEWCLNKDDISPQDIFDKHKLSVEKGGAAARAEVAKYCIQDCELCINLLLLLDIIPNNLGMANVSYVPASYIFLRGQGVKVTSVVSKTCAQRNTRIPDLKKLPYLRDYVKMIKNGASEQEVKDKMIEDADWRKPKEWELTEWYEQIKNPDEYVIEGYEGAVVLDPKPGIYLDDPIAVLDYASLYPSSIIEKNLSHETLIEDKSLLPVIGEENYYTIEYQNWIYRGKGKGDTIEKVLNEDEPMKICHFLKPEYMVEKGMVDPKKPMGIIPSVLDHLLSARKATKKRMGSEKDEFKKKVLDGLQLAYKVTANSVYGQLGAKTSTIFKLNIAACTTSIGRSRIDDASDGVKEWARLKRYKEPDVIYGDTDSVFVKFSREKDGKILTGAEAVEHCIQCGIESGKFITHGGEFPDDTGNMISYPKRLCNPQDLEYEKTFWPFILISKKRYTGDKYEFSFEDGCKRTAMGIVLKRRDNAPIVKHVFGNVIERIMIDKDFDLAVNWLKETLQQIRNEQFILRYFVITKALRGYYKNPGGIAHKVLADRMAERDPGNKPKANDRIPYAYIELPDSILYDAENPYKSGIRKGKPRVRNIKQGDRIEHIDYIVDNKKKLDYEFYITNQIKNPVKQVLDLEMDAEETEALFQ